MPFFVSRRALAELQARADRCQDRAERAEKAEMVQSGANGILAARTGLQLNRAMGYDDHHVEGETA